MKETSSRLASQDKAKVRTRVGSPREWPLLVWGVLGLALLLRVAFLEWKAPHFDESINGHFVDQIWRNGYFRYDPSNFHGPLYFYLLHIAELLLGRGVFAFRLLTAFLSFAIVMVVAMHSRYLGKAAFWAATLIALSTGMIFYGRYAIHETLLILGEVIFSYGFLRWRFERDRVAVAWMSLGIVIAVTTKETFFIFFGTWAIAWYGLGLSRRLWPRLLVAPQELEIGGLASRGERTSEAELRKAFVLAIFLGAGAILAFFSGFFFGESSRFSIVKGLWAVPQGWIDMISAFAFWTKTGTGATGHEKPFFYWLQLMGRYEPATLLAFIVAPFAILFGTFWFRFYALLSFGLWLAYSLIPYKTPWCVLGIIWPLAFVFGQFLSRKRFRWEFKGIRSAFFAGSLLTLVMGLGIAVRLNFRDFEASGEPYVYVQTTQDVPRALRVIEGRVRLQPESRGMKIQVLNKDPWPFPWLLAHFPKAEFSGLTASTRLDGEVIFADEAQKADIESRLSRSYIRKEMRIRDAYQAGYVYFDEAAFAPWFDAKETRVQGGSR